MNESVANPYGNQDDVLRTFAAKRGHFAYESGYHGNLYLNLDRVVGNPSTLTHALDILAQQVAALTPDVVCGPLTGGAFIAFSIASKLSMRFCWSARTAQDTGRDLFPFGYRIEGDLDGLEGKRVVIVDDAINAASAIRGTLNSLRSLEMDVIAIASLLTIGSSAAQLYDKENLHLVTLATVESRLWTPLECPLCNQNAPVIKIS